LRHVVIALSRHIVAEACSAQRFAERSARRYMARLTVAIGAGAHDPAPTHLERGRVDHPRERRVTAAQPERYAEERMAMGEVGGAIDGVDEEAQALLGAFDLTLALLFLAYDGDLREQAPEL